MRKEAQCPFCMSTEYFDPPTKDVSSGPNVAWRGDKGPGITIALKHKPTCPRYLKCMGCGGDAITGIYGLCYECCVKEEDRRNAEAAQGYRGRLTDIEEPGESESGYREIDVTALTTTVKIIPRDGGEPIEANGAKRVRFLSDKMDERGICQLVDFIGRGEVRLAFSTTTVPLEDGWYTIELADFVPDFHRCLSCHYVGEDFRYDPNPKSLPVIETPILGVLVDPVQEQGPIDLGDGGPPVDPPTWAGTGPRRTTGIPAIDEVVGKGFERGKLADLGLPMRRRHARVEFIKAQAGDPDIHTRTAMEMFKVEAKDVTPEMRQKGKTRNFEEAFGRKGLSAIAAVAGVDPNQVSVSIAEMFGCARTGEEGAIYCGKCQSYDIAHVSEAERNQLLFEAYVAEYEATRDDSGFSPVNRGEPDFIDELRTAHASRGFEGFTVTQVVRLYASYKP